MAVVDACARHQGVPLYTLLGAHGGLVRTDITIPICSAEQAYALAETYKQEGFTQIKTKIGLNMVDDIDRLRNTSCFPGGRLDPRCE